MHSLFLMHGIVGGRVGTEASARASASRIKNNDCVGDRRRSGRARVGEREHAGECRRAYAERNEDERSAT